MLQMSTALGFAKKAALQLTTTNFPSMAVGVGNELPPSLRNNPKFVMIYYLPRVLSEIDKPLASRLMTLWQYGKAKGTIPLDQNSLLPLKNFHKFSPMLLKSSSVFEMALQAFLLDRVGALTQLGSEQLKTEQQWEKFRIEAKKLISKNLRKDAWEEQTGNYLLSVADPPIPIGFKSFGLVDYISAGKSPMSSDAYFSLGECAFRACLQGKFIKKPGDPLIYFSPIKVGVRIFDNYDFSDSVSFKTLVDFFVGGSFSQYLGTWASTTDTAIILQNADFAGFREEFRKSYNSFLDSTRSAKDRLVCKDFHPISDFVEQVVDPVEYALKL